MYGREYDEQICATLPHPLEAEIAECEKAKLFVAPCNKVMFTISTKEDMLTMVVSIFDIGADLNLIWEDSLPTSWLTDIQPIRVSKRAASDT